MGDALKKCSGCGCVTDGRCHVDVAGFTCGQPLCDDCTHVDQRYSWTHEPKNELVKRLRDGVVFVDSDAAGVSGVISEFKTDALCYEAADRIEELEKENFILAATQCPFPDGEGLTGSPSGYSYCAKDVELEGCDEYIQSLIKTIEEADEQIEELETKLEKAEKIQKP